MATPVESLNVENVVATSEVDQELDLATLAQDLNTESDFIPERFPGVVYRLSDPKAACLIFRSGNLVVTGASSIESAKSAVGKVMDDLGELGINVADSPEITIQNIVTSGDLGQQLNLNAVAVGFGLEDVEYEPEQFPGLVYRPQEQEVVTLLFGSGKVVITGGTEPADAEAGIQQIQEELDRFGLLD